MNYGLDYCLRKWRITVTQQKPRNPWFWKRKKHTFGTIGWGLVHSTWGDGNYRLSESKSKYSKMKQNRIGPFHLGFPQHKHVGNLQNWRVSPRCCVFDDIVVTQQQPCQNTAVNFSG